MDDCLEDDLQELRELLGVAEDPEHDTRTDGDDAPDSESRHELQRLLANLDRPVSAGSDYTVLQVQTDATQLWPAENRPAQCKLVGDAQHK